jgi:hypothetical protein
MLQTADNSPWAKGRLQLNMVSAPFDKRAVAIPRLQRTGQGQYTVNRRHRVPRACTAVSEPHQYELLEMESWCGSNLTVLQHQMTEGGL